jgi:HEAT repeat protein
VGSRPGRPRSRLAGRVDKVLNSVLAGEPGTSLNLSATELLSEPVAVAAVIADALDRPESNLGAHWRVHQAFSRSGVSAELINSLVASNPLTRTAAARLCGALRLTEAVDWIADLVRDPNPNVREAAVRALAQLGGRRAVEILVHGDDQIPLYRQAIALSRAAADLDIEALMRQPKSERAAVVTVLACGLRRDTLRVAPLLGIAHDRRWPTQVRLASCVALGAIGDQSVVEGLAHLATAETEPAVKQAAERACRRLQRAAGAAVE